MKQLFRLIILISPILSFSQVEKNIRDTIYREAELYTLLDGIKHDSLLMLERMASFHFHQLINEYRLNKGKNTIYWDDKLWLAARNHNVYLIQNNKSLSHSESSNKSYFTGSSPESRVDFVTYSTGEYKLGGFENCAVSGEMIPASMDKTAFSLDNINELVYLAKSAAEEIFKLWKESPGHNQNMLNSEHLAHGTSIIFGEYAQYGTSVFTQNQKYYTPDTIDLLFSPEISKNFEVRFEEKGYLTTPYPKNLNRVEFKMFKSVSAVIESYSIVPNKKLYELLKKEKLAKIESPKKNYLKMTHYLGVFKFLKYDLIRIEESFLLPEEDYLKLDGIEKIKDLIQRNKKYLFQANSWAGSINTLKEGQQIKVTLRMYLFTPKKNN